MSTKDKISFQSLKISQNMTTCHLQTGVEIPHDGVIGNNFMRRHECVISFKTY